LIKRQGSASLYATEGAWTGTSNAIRRDTLRLDGFVSINAPWKGGELHTRPVQFAGSELRINFATSAAGGLRVELQDLDRKPIPGFTLDDCPEIFGDTLDRTVNWKQGADVSKLSGIPVRMRFVMKDADLYSLQFTVRVKTCGKPT
jgi:hypothetical protein